MNEGYDLYIFNMIHSSKPHNPGVAAIKDFEHRIEKRYLRKEGSVWYADITGHTYPDELTFPEQYTEGARKAITVNAYERNPEARKACIRRMVTSARAVDSISKKPPVSRAKTLSTSIILRFWQPLVRAIKLIREGKLAAIFLITSNVL